MVGVRISPPPASLVPLPICDGEDFGGAARRLAGLAGIVFGWSPDVFWGATPAELAAVVEAGRGEDAPVADAGDLERLMEAFPDG